MFSELKSTMKSVSTSNKIERKKKKKKKKVNTEARMSATQHLTMYSNYRYWYWVWVLKTYLDSASNIFLLISVWDVMPLFAWNMVRASFRIYLDSSLLGPVD
jgi:hypothetical protein